MQLMFNFLLFLSCVVEKKNGPAQRRGHKQTATDLKAEEDY